MTANMPEATWTVERLITRAVHADDTQQYRLAGHYISRAREILRDQRIRNYADHLAMELTEQIRRNFEASRAERQAELSLASAIADDDFWSAAGIIDGNELDAGGMLPTVPDFVMHRGPAPLEFHPNPYRRPGRA